ncbi:hypothetical protein ACOCLD_11255 [Pseudomonas sp. MAC6]|uniref:hypothetical protein n=1 Tax=Pseudomonas sp. MAC6 TaxID=3401633 RepID=UPI003BF573BC
MNIDSMDAKPAEQLPIVIEGHAFKPNTEGLWSLTEINKGLPELTKAPAQWRGRERDYFERCADLHVVHGDQGGTWATERATIAYAMACSLDFFVMVVDAFVTMRNDAILSARMASLALVERDQLLADNMPKADAFMRKAETIGLSWSEACCAAGVHYPRLSKDYLLAQGKFTKKVAGSMESSGQPIPRAEGFQRGFFKRCETTFGNRDSFRVTPKGLLWLQGKAREINEAIRARKLLQSK